ncbi:MAG: cation transporter [Calditrichia bacterium]
MEIRLSVPGMSCNHCKMAVTSAVQEVHGVENVEVNLESKMVNVAGDPDVDELVSAIENAGYTVEEVEQ